jgi:hypothetical protein
MREASSYMREDFFMMCLGHSRNNGCRSGFAGPAAPSSLLTSPVKYRQSETERRKFALTKDSKTAMRLVGLLNCSDSEPETECP